MDKEITLHTILDSLQWAKIAKDYTTTGMSVCEFEGEKGEPLIDIVSSLTPDLLRIEWKDKTQGEDVILEWDRHQGQLTANSDPLLFERGRLNQFLTQVSMISHAEKPTFFPGLVSKTLTQPSLKQG